MSDVRRAQRRSPFAIWAPASAVAAAMLLPLAYLLIRGSDNGLAAMWDVLAAERTMRLLGRTVGLATSVTITTVLIALPLAFLTGRTDMPARKLFSVLVALPLVIPTFVGAFALIAAIAPGGLVQESLAGLGVTVTLPSPYGFWGAFAALTLFTYPYVLLTVRGALRGIDPSLEEASRALGHSAWSTFRRVTLPQLRPATAAGALLVALYVVSDFGAVSLMRYSTFTRAIYIQYQSAFDRTPAAILSLVLVAVTVTVITGEARLGRARHGEFRRAHGTSVRPNQAIKLGPWRWPALLFTTTVVLAALVLPLSVVGVWLVRGLQAGESLALTFTAAANSVQAAGLGAVAVVAAALPVAIWTVRYPGRLSRLVERASFTGYALPGIVVALSLVFFGARLAPALYQTRAMLVLAYVVLFLPQAVGAIRSSLLQIAPNVEEAARSLGASPMQVVRQVLLPLSRRGTLFGLALVFLTALKELPATLLLAPTGFSTLATRIWAATSEAFFARAAAPAFILLLLGAAPLALLVVRERDDH